MGASLSKDDLKTTFENLRDGRDVAAALDLSYNQLRYNAASKRQHKHYRVFEVKKKSGGTRTITAPTRFWKGVQQCLARLLGSVYEPRAVVHGFTRERNVCTNAEPHIRRRFVLNIDLEDFFPSINFGRVRGLFLKPPYNCTPEVATLLAQICCFNNQLPQGAPTSPIVSNMICSRLDSNLSKLAAVYGCSYTRYADDITLSADHDKFPRDLAEIKSVDGESQCVPGRKILSVIERNGFKINLSKVRLQSHHQRQEVTGLIANRKVNVERAYVREVRALLHNWRTKGLRHCQETYEAQYIGQRSRPSHAPPPLFNRLVKGKIDYLGMVRGKGDPLFLKFLRELSVLDPELVDLTFLQRRVEGPEGSYLVPTNTDETEELLEHVWVIITEDDEKIRQGTGFFLKGCGLVTCSHVLGGRGVKYIHAISRDGKRRYDARILARDGIRDVAILDIGFTPHRSLEASVLQVKRTMPVTVLGFPNHNIGDTGFVFSGNVTGFRREPISGESVITISATIIEGNSGGPVLDSTGKVIGVAARGGKNQKEAQETEFHAVVPISAVRDLVHNN